MNNEELDLCSQHCSKKTTMIKFAIHSTILIFTCLGMGCGQSEQGRAVEKKAVPQTAIKLVETSLDSPLTEGEVTQFLKIVQQLPDQEVPAFNKADLSLSIKEDEDFDIYVESLRHSLRSAINAEAQGTNWRQEKSLAKAFQSIGVSPEDFAKLATKITLAWSAAAVKGEVPILLTQRRLTEQLEQAEKGYRDEAATPKQQQEIIKRVQELVALNEFLLLVQNTPEGSLHTIRRTQSQLGEVLPKLDLAAQFEKFLINAPEVAQTKYTIQ